MSYLAAIFVYLMILTGIGLYKARQVKTGADFSVAGRTLSPWVVVLTMLSVWIGTGSIVGSAEQTYQVGKAALILPLGTFLGLLILTQIAGRARGFGVYSVPEIIGTRYGKLARMLAVISLIIAYMVILSYQFNAGGAVLEVINGEKPAVDLKEGDELTGYQIRKSFVHFTPDVNWTGETKLALVAKTAQGWSDEPIELTVQVIAKGDIIAAREDVKKKELKNILPIKVNNYAKYGMMDLSDDFGKRTEFKIVSVPQPGSLTLVEPVITAQKATLVAATFIIIYTVLAGLMSLAYCDVLNGSIKITVMLVVFPYLLIKAGWFSGMANAFAAMGDRPDYMKFWGVYTWPQLINYLLPTFLLIMGDANQYQRLFASKSAKSAKQAAYALVFLVILVELLIIASSWVAASMTPDPSNGKYILIYSAKHYMPQVLGLLFMVTVVAVIVSTAESFLFIPANTIIQDIYKVYINTKASEKKILFFSRLFVLIFGVVGYLVTLMFSESTGFFKKAMFAYTIYGAAITPCLVAAIFWKRATRQGAVTSIVCGAVISLCWKEAFFTRYFLSAQTFSSLAAKIPEWVKALDAVLPAITVSVIALIVVSLLTAKKELEVSKI
jgi:Na+/proline symporter